MVLAVLKQHTMQQLHFDDVKSRLGEIGTQVNVDLDTPCCEVPSHMHLAVNIRPPPGMQRKSRVGYTLIH